MYSPQYLVFKLNKKIPRFFFLQTKKIKNGGINDFSTQ
jgi:hypothetical protein